PCFQAWMGQALGIRLGSHASLLRNSRWPAVDRLLFPHHRVRLSSAIIAAPATRIKEEQDRSHARRDGRAWLELRMGTGAVAQAGFAPRRVASPIVEHRRER